MTENEALKLGKSLYENITSNANNIISTKEYIEFVGMAIQALEDMQKLKELGECYIIPKNGTFEINGINVHTAVKELEQYRAIGTVDEFKALKEKNEPKKAIKNNPIINDFWSEESMLCPNCHGWVSRLGYCFCDKCGQKLDWGNE